jgi:hypothetical protein
MPTGYTAGILDGTITDFKGFAKTCMRAFGATIHMRDEGLDKEYEPREPSEYHLERINEYKEELKKAQNTTPEEFEKKERIEIKNEIQRVEEQLVKKKESFQKLQNMLEQADSWNPPTEEHSNFKSFMIEQLESTIRFDADLEYYEQKKEEAFHRLGEVLDGEQIKKRAIDLLKERILYQEKSYKEELDRCEKSNKWVEDLIQSI